MNAEKLLYNMALASILKEADGYAQTRGEYQPGFGGDVAHVIGHPLNSIAQAATLPGQLYDLGKLKMQQAFPPAPAPAALPQGSPYQTNNQKNLTGATGYGNLINQIQGAADSAAGGFR